MFILYSINKSYKSQQLFIAFYKFTLSVYYLLCLILFIIKLSIVPYFEQIPIYIHSYYKIVSLSL